MIPLLTTLRQFWRAMKRGLADARFRALTSLVLILLATGTIFYWREEGWTVLDSMYFSVITLTTIGYGDLAPSTSASKVFTMIYALLGLGILVSFLTTLAGHAVEARVDRSARRSKDT